MICLRERKDFELLIDVRAGTRETALEEAQTVFPFAWTGCLKIIFFRAFEAGGNHKQRCVVANGDGLVLAEFPAKILRCREPDSSGRDEGLRKRFQASGLKEFGGPGLDVCLL